MRYLWVCILSLALPGFAHADKIIMKDGKIYDGRIMGETQRSILISTAQEPHPRFLRMNDVMTIVRESHAPPPDHEPKRYVMVETLVGAAAFTSRALEMPPAPMLHFGGGFRLYPLVELDADLDWMPAASGRLSITDGTNLRGYDHFWGYSGGFGARVFPFASKDWKTEPYALVGYQWTRLLPKASDDYLKGSLWKIGVGAQRPWIGALYLDARIVYQRVRYDSLAFLSNTGTLVSSIANDQILLLTGVSYHFR
jgi:hypothetical protein